MKILKPDTNHTINRLKKPAPRTLSIIVKAAVVVVILLLGYGVSAWIKNSAPTAKRRPPEIAAPYVEVLNLAPAARQVVVEVYGTVVPKTKIDIKARVAGEIVAVNKEYIEGGIISANTEMARIDPKDYELAIKAKKAELAAASYNLKLEEGQQVVARSEWELLKDSDAFAKVQSTDLALRKPHLDKARADLEAAKAGLSQAELNLARTSVSLPFNALILSKNADLGSHVNVQETVAVVADIDAYHVQASVPVHNLQWLNFDDENGSQAKIFYGGSNAVTGRLVKLLGDLEPNGRMARVLIEIEDPMRLKPENQGQTPLLLGEYVRVEITGALISDILAIDRTLLHDDDSVWLLTEGRLEITPVNVLWRGRHEIFITNTELIGRDIVLTALPAPVNGMQLRIEPANTEPLATEPRPAN